MHTYGKKMARDGRTKDIYKGTFICIQTLINVLFSECDQKGMSYFWNVSEMECALFGM